MTMYDRIKELRIESGMTQDDLARAMGYKDRSMITKIEGGKVDISQKKIDEFAKILNTTPAYLMGWTETKRIPFAGESLVMRLDPELFPALQERVKHSTPKEDAELTTLWRNASLSAKRAVIAVLKSMEGIEK